MVNMSRFTSLGVKNKELWLLGMALLFPAFLETVELKYDRFFTKPHQVIVDGGFLEVRIEGEKRDDVHIKGILDEVGMESSYEWVAEELDGELKFHLHAKSSLNSNVEGKLIISVPLNTQLKIINSSGDIWISHLDSEEVSLKSASGKITLLDCQGQFKVSATSGEINASHLTGKVRLNTVSGDQHLQLVKGNVVSRTVSGQIDASDLRGDINLESTCGNIDLAEVYGDLELETQSGSVMIRGLHVQEAKIRSITGKLGLQVEEPLENFTIYMSSETGEVNLEGKRLGRKWRQEGPRKKIKLSTVSGAIRLDSAS